MSFPLGGINETARFHHGTWYCGYVATRGPGAATGEDEAGRFRFAGSHRSDLRVDVLGSLGPLGRLVRRDARLSSQAPEPAAVGLSYFLNGDDIHLLSGVTELLPGEPVRGTSFFDEGGRHRSVCQNVRQEGLQAGFYSSPSELWFGLFDRWRPPRTQSAKYVPGHHRHLLACS